LGDRSVDIDGNSFVEAWEASRARHGNKAKVDETVGECPSVHYHSWIIKQKMEKKQSKKLTKKLKERRLSAEISGYVHVDVLV